MKMWSPTTRFGKKVLIIMLVFLIISVLVPVNAYLSKKVDETSSMPQAPNLGMKCTTCSCTNPCVSQLPPPPPPPPPPSSQDCNPIAVPPPPPRFYYFTNPLPLAPPPPRFYYFTSPLPLAPPPPPQGFVYFSGPPGNSYRTNPSDVDIFFGGTRSDVINLRGFIGSVLLQVFTFFLL